MSKETRSLQKKENEQTIEETFIQLEEVVDTLEKEDLPLEQAFESYKQGIELLKSCHRKLDAVEKKVLILNEDGELDEF